MIGRLILLFRVPRFLLSFRGPIQLLRQVGLFLITGLSNAQGVSQAQPYFDLDHLKSFNHPIFHFLFFTLTQNGAKNKK